MEFGGINWTCDLSISKIMGTAQLLESDFFADTVLNNALTEWID